MNRFEQANKQHISHHIAYALPLAAFLILLLFFLNGVSNVNETTLFKQQESLETALTRSITQCYAVEGIYPPSLEYLTEHYGLLYDADTFLIDYDYYGSNLLPDVTVLRKSTR